MRSVLWSRRTSVARFDNGVALMAEGIYREVGAQRAGSML
jgi:hypothetical protein